MTDTTGNHWVNNNLIYMECPFYRILTRGCWHPDASPNVHYSIRSAGLSQQLGIHHHPWQAVLGSCGSLFTEDEEKTMWFITCSQAAREGMGRRWIWLQHACQGVNVNAVQLGERQTNSSRSKGQVNFIPVCLCVRYRTRAYEYKTSAAFSLKHAISSFTLPAV